MRNPMLAVLLAGIFFVTALPTGAQSIRDTRPPVTPLIANRVLDLLNEEFVLDPTHGPTIWQSSPFGTSQANRIGLRFAAEMDRGVISCQVCWRFTTDDEFQCDVPAVTKVRYEFPPLLLEDPEGLRRPDGIPDIYIQRPYYPYYAPDTGFTGVRGLEAMVQCSLGPARSDLGRIVIVNDPFGDDPYVDPPGGPGDGDGDIDPMGTAVLTDVKVLLRRE